MPYYFKSYWLKNLMGKKFKEDVTRQSTFLGLKAWHKGESEELEKWVGFGFSIIFFYLKTGR